MKEIIPTVFTIKGQKFFDKLDKVIDLSDKIHLDIMDGEFVPERSFPLKKLPNFREYNKEFSVHLMTKFVRNELPIVAEKGIKKVIFHFEAQPTNSDIFQNIKIARGYKLQVGLAISPETEIEVLEPFIDSIDSVLLMGVDPGAEGQEFEFEVYEKVENLRKKNKSLIIEVDGGINENVARELSRAGANVLYVGSYLSSAEFPEVNLEILESSFK